VAAYVMRHLDTPAGERDPDLLPAGGARAEQLAALLANRGIAAIYVTDYRRSRQTAEPLARRLGLVPIVYDPGDPGALVARLRGGPRPALVVGHSNTVPQLVAALGGTPPAPLFHGDFGTIWAIGQDGSTRILQLEAAAP
jgi:broad specificity phosphatase PhoE